MSRPVVMNRVFRKLNVAPRLQWALYVMRILEPMQMSDSCTCAFSFAAAIKDASSVRIDHLQRYARLPLRARHGKTGPPGGQPGAMPWKAACPARPALAPYRLVDRHNPYPQRQEGDRDDLKAGEPQRDADDRQAQQDPGHQVTDRQLPAKQDDPDDVADQGADPHPALARRDGPAERPQHIARDPERGDPERDRDDQEEQ